jgi:trans-aconitate methyltransferase
MSRPGRWIIAVLEERLALMAPARRQRLALTDATVKACAARPGLRALDAGCGDGLLTISLAGRHPDWNLVGVDLRDDMLEGARARARSRSLENVSFVAGDLEQPLPERGQDVVLAIECLSEIPDDRLALRQMVEALQPGGLLVVHVPERDWHPVFPASPSTWREQVRQGYDASELSAALQGAGLERIEVKPTYRSLAAAAQEIRDRIKDSPLPIRLAAFPFLAAAVWLEQIGVTWGGPNALIGTGRRPAATAPSSG